MTLVEINKAVNDRIKAALRGAGLAVPLLDEDLEKPIARPSVKVVLEDGSSGRFNGCCAERSVTVRVYFYAADRYRPKPENTAMRELLEAAFLDDLLVAGGAIPIERISGTVSDGVLVCSFDLYRVELLPEPDAPRMETLEIRKGDGQSI